MLPSLFVSHGAPTLVLDAVPAREFLAALPERLAAHVALAKALEAAGRPDEARRRLREADAVLRAPSAR